MENILNNSAKIGFQNITVSKNLDLDRSSNEPKEKYLKWCNRFFFSIDSNHLNNKFQQRILATMLVEHNREDANASLLHILRNLSNSKLFDAIKWNICNIKKYNTYDATIG